MARAFVAVVPPDDVLDAVDLALSRARTRVPGARWSTRDQWHITLQFLGSGVDLDAIAEGMGELTVAAESVRLGGAGAFPRERRGTVLWIGVVTGVGMLGRLAESVGAALSPLGHEQDVRPFHPHVTLARLRVPGDLRGAIEAVGQDPLGPEWQPSSVVLAESRLRSDGARYRVHATFPLR